MGIIHVRAKIACDGCAKPFEVSIDPARKLPWNWSVDDCVWDLVRFDDQVEGTSVQGDHMLCRACTKVVDAAHPGEAKELTYDEVSRALNEAAGV